MARNVIFHEQSPSKTSSTSVRKHLRLLHKTVAVYFKKVRGVVRIAGVACR